VSGPRHPLRFWLGAHPRVGAAACLLGAIAVACLGLEVVLRLVIRDDSRIDGGLVYDRERNSLHYERQFLRHYGPTSSLRAEDYDPWLGWDTDIARGRVRGRTLGGTFHFAPSSACKVIVIGNSFSYGSQVGAQETYASFLEKCLSRTTTAECLNMGMGGYGIDQAVLKYLRYGAPYRPNVVVLGVFVDNYERTGLRFFVYYKPYYVIDRKAGTIRLVSPVIPPPHEGYARLQRQIGRYPVYLVPFVWNRLVRVYWDRVNSDRRTTYFRDMDEIVAGILGQLQASLRNSGTRLIVLQIPHGEAFGSASQLARERRNPAYLHLVQIYRRLGIEYVDLLDEFPRQFPLRDVCHGLYLPLPGGDQKSRGHFSVKGNRVVAEILAKKILEGAPSPPGERPGAAPTTSRPGTPGR
jgi:hypothetical protein